MLFPLNEDERDRIPPGRIASPEELRTVRIDIAAATAVLPITPEMAWAVPQLLKRMRLVSPDVISTNGVLRTLVRTPGLDAPIAKVLADSGFLSCDALIARSSWRFELQEMLEREHTASAQVLEHCRDVLARHRTGRPFDWEEVLDNLRTLRSWFPELRTIEQLEQLYGRLHVLHAKAVLVAQLWLDLRGAVLQPLASRGHEPLVGAGRGTR